MIKLLVFLDKEIRPKKSGDYLTYFKDGGFYTTTHYSKDWDCWGAYDSMTKEQLQCVYEPRFDKWAKIGEL